jgi:hypothetical protein
MSDIMTEPQGPPVQAPPKRRWYRRRWFLVPAVVVVALLGLFVAGAGLDFVMKTADTYQADLTTGSGDFRAVTIGNTATSYQPDGFHLRIAQAGVFRPAGVTTPRPYIAAEVTATATQVSSPAGAGFGPLCVNDLNNGYWMALAPGGQVTISYLNDGAKTVIGRGQAAAWPRGQTRKLTLVCHLGRAGDRISASVNGVKVAEAAHQSAIASIKGTGFAGSLPTTAPGPGEWTVTSFSRSNPLA